MTNKLTKELGDAEAEVLKVLWDLGPSGVRPVMEELHARGRRGAYTTVQTMLNRLEEKGYVRRDTSEYAHVYRARVTRERVTRSRIKNLLRQFYDDAAGPLVQQLIASEEFDAREIKELRELVDRLDTDDKDRSKKRQDQERS